LIVPPPAIAFSETPEILNQKEHTVDRNTISTPKPEACGVLKDKLKAMVLPVGCVIGELNVSLDIYSPC
jgi:hypothetical protein